MGVKYLVGNIGKVDDLAAVLADEVDEWSSIYGTEKSKTTEPSERPTGIEPGSVIFPHTDCRIYLRRGRANTVRSSTCAGHVTRSAAKDLAVHV